MCDILVYKEDTTYCAKDCLSENILASSDSATEILQLAVDSIPPSGGKILLKPALYAGPGVIDISEDKPLTIEGETIMKAIGGGDGVFLDDIVFKSSRSDWGQAYPLMLKNIKIRAKSDIAINAQYKLVYLEDVAIILLKPDQYAGFVQTVAGPPGVVVTWKNVSFYHKPESALTYHSKIADIHYENLRISGLNIVIDNDYETAYGSNGILLRGVGVYALENIEIFFGMTARMGGVKVFQMLNAINYELSHVFSNIVSVNYVEPANVIYFDVAQENAKLYLKSLNLVKPAANTYLLNPTRDFLLPRLFRLE